MPCMILSLWRRFNNSHDFSFSFFFFREKMEQSLFALIQKMKGKQYKINEQKTEKNLLWVVGSTHHPYECTAYFCRFSQAKQRPIFSLYALNRQVPFSNFKTNEYNIFFAWKEKAGCSSWKPAKNIVFSFCSSMNDHIAFGTDDMLPCRYFLGRHVRIKEILNPSFYIR